MTEIPEHLLKRAQEARDKAGAAEPAAESAAAGSASEPASDPRIPEHLLQRSKAAKAKAEGGDAAESGGGGVAVADQVSSVVQFGLKPLVAFLLISWFGLSGIIAGVLIMIFVTPTAPSAYILARQLGGDTDTMASIITFQTLLAFVVMPVAAVGAVAFL